jgi:hypothetical protein
MVSVVNGFVCQSGCDEAVARKGRDPRNPKNDPVKAEALAIRDGKAKPTDDVSGAGAAQIVSFGKDESTVAASAATDGDRRNPASPALFYDRQA